MRFILRIIAMMLVILSLPGIVVSTRAPTRQPTTQPTSQPSRQPFSRPSRQPSSQPSGSPTIRTLAPSEYPTMSPSEEPTEPPTIPPSTEPSEIPSEAPTHAPDMVSLSPTLEPTTHKPSISPSIKPSIAPSIGPSTIPTIAPSQEPSEAPMSDPTMVPTQSPSRRPSRPPTMGPTRKINPTSCPSVQPSNRPSRQPIGHPTSQPSSVPSVFNVSFSSHPTAGVPSIKPTRKPTSRPLVNPTQSPTTRLPSQLPSLTPTAVPSEIPSAIPSGKPIPVTNKPSLQPTQPTSQPSRQPINHPTSQPSAQPSQKPSTFGDTARKAIEKSLWVSALQSTLNAASQPENIVYQTNYYEFDLLGFTPYTVFGSCSSWQSKLSGDIALSLSQYQPVSIQFTVIQAKDVNAYDFNTYNAICDNTASIGMILGLVSGTIQNASMSQGISTSCNGRVWKVKTCSAGSKPAMCVDCSDPCSTTSHCTSSLGSTALQAPFTISPCISQSCSGTSLGSAIRLLVVNFHSLQAAPDIDSITITPYKSSLLVNATLSADGTVYCGAFLKGTAVSSNLQTLIALQNAASSSKANVSVVRLSQLTPVTAYTVYCYSQTAFGTKMSLSKTIATSVDVSTMCCKTLSVGLSATSAVENTAVTSIVTLSLSARPSISTSVAFGQGSTLFWPSSFSVGPSTSTAADGSISLKSSLVASPAGLYPFTVTVSGASAEYELLYTNNANTSLNFGVFTVYSSVTEPPTPSLLSATFSSDGSFMTILFDSSTNRGGSATSFVCSTLFTFGCDSTSRCLWVDDATVTAYVNGGGRCAEPQMSFGLSSSARIKAKCPSSVCSGQPGWANVPFQSLVIQAPLVSVPPNVIISSPSVIGSCDSWTIDVSGSSNSGGRSFKKSVLTITSGNDFGNLALQQYIAGLNFTVSSPTVIPQNFLSKGQFYTCVVMLCNFLGQCGSSAKSVWIRKSPVPVVKLPGQSLRYITRSTVLSMYSLSSFVSCNGSSSNSLLTYSWTISSNGVQNVNLFSVSRDPSKLLLPAYSLSTSVLYTVTLTVTVSTTLASSSASATVFVQQGSIYASVVGGNTRSIRLNETAVIDASTSRDDDVQYATGANAGLKYSWKSVQMSPTVNATCDAVSASAFDSEVIFIYAPLDASVDTVCMFTVTVSDAENVRSDTLSVIVSVLPALSPLVILGSNVQKNVVNPSQVLRIFAEVFMPANVMGVVSWSLSDDSVDLVSAANSPLNVSILPSMDPQLAMISLVLKPNTLISGVSLSFGLLCSSSVGTTTASIVILVNSPPAPGSFMVTPPSGIELIDTFTFQASLWVDDQLPITYQFGYMAADGTFVLLRPRNEFTNSANQLTAGLLSARYSVICVAQVFDSLTANTTTNFAVTVFNGTAVDPIGIEEYVASHIVSGSTASDILQCGAIASYLLNSVDCSESPDCIALNRQNCSRTTNTCGSCLSGAYLGDFGDSNNPCVSSAIGGAEIGHNCFDSSDCTGLAQCESSICVMPNKKCPANCSGRGQCVFVDNGGDEVDACGLNDGSCLAVCRCPEGFTLSSTCSLSDADLIVKQTVRSMLINATANLLFLQDPDSQSIQGWMGALNQASAQPDELTVESAQILFRVAQNILTYSHLEDFTLQNFDDLLSVIDHATYAFNRNFWSTSLDRRLSSSNLTQSGWALSGGSIQGIADSILQKMVAGEYPSSVVRNNFRFVSQVVSYSVRGNRIDSDASGNVVSISVPLLGGEDVTGAGADSASFTVDNSNQTDLQITLISMSSRLIYASRVNSNPLTIAMSASPCIGDVCRSEVTLHFDQSLVSDEVEYVNTTCLLGDTTPQNYTCKNSQILNTTCNGTAGFMLSECPRVNLSAMCDALNGDTPYDVGCTVTSFTSTNVTCDCPLVFDNVTIVPSSNIYSGEKVDYSSSTSGRSVSFVAMVDSTWKTFTGTWISAKDLNAESVAKGWQVLQTLAVFGSVVIFVMIVAYQLDDRARVYGGGDLASRSETKVWQMLEDSIKAAMKKPNGNKVMPSNLARQERANQREQKLMKLQDRLFSLTKINKDLALAEEYLPKVTHSTPMMEKITQELKMHHRWFSVWYYYSEYFPRWLRVLALTTNIIIMLFFQSICYNLIKPDDGSCEELQTRNTCLARKSDFFTRGTKCQWTGSSPYVGECSFIVPSDRWNVILFVGLISALIGAPLAVVANYAIRNYLGAPTEIITPKKKISTPVSTSPRVKLKPADIRLATELRKKAPVTVEKEAMAEKSKILNEMMKHRKNLSSEAERLEFDGAWKLDSNGNFQSSEHADQVRRVVADLKDVIQKERNEIESINKTIPENAKEIGKRLLFLLQADLLPGIRGKALIIKGDRDFSPTKPTTKVMQIFVATVLFLLLFAMVFYIYLFAKEQTALRQQSWFNTFVVWLVVEILITSTNACLITHVIIPCVSIGDATKVKLQLIEAIKKYQANVHRVIEGLTLPAMEDENSETIFDANKHFFVSARVARNYSTLREAQIISMFRSPWPRQLYGERSNQPMSYGIVSLTVRALTVMLIVVLNVFLNMTVVIQDGVVEICTRGLAYGCARLFVKLWDINPVLAFFPVVAIVILIHFGFNTKGSYTREQLMRLRELTKHYLSPSSSPKSRSPMKSPTNRKSPDSDRMHYAALASDDDVAMEKVESPLFSNAVQDLLDGLSNEQIDQMNNEKDPSFPRRFEYDEESKGQESTEDEQFNTEGLQVVAHNFSFDDTDDDMDVPVVRRLTTKGGISSNKTTPGMTVSIRSPRHQLSELNSYNRANGMNQLENGSDDPVFFEKMSDSIPAEHDRSECGHGSLTSKMYYGTISKKYHMYQMSSDDSNSDSDVGDDVPLAVRHVNSMKTDSGNGNNTSMDVNTSQSVGFSRIKFDILQQHMQQKRRLDGLDDSIFEDEVEQPAVVSTLVKDNHGRSSSRGFLSRIFG